MYCKNCGKEIWQEADFCTNCGSRPLNGSSYCQSCGISVNSNQEVCLKCGMKLNNKKNASSTKNYKLFCRNCGNEINGNADVCTKCGNHPLNGKSFCQSCGSITNENQEICIKCGVRLIKKYTTYNSSPNAFLDPYYQEEFGKISGSNEKYKGKWNWCAFFFSWIWALTKGLWGLALITLVIEGTIFAIPGQSSVLNLAVAILWGIRGNYFYYNLYTNDKQFPDTL